MACLPLNYQTLIEIDITPNAGSSTWARVAAGVSSIDLSNNDSLDQTGYLDGEGYQTTDVIGAQLTLSVSGHRVPGDAAQDYVKSVETSLGCDRKTNARITFADGEQREGECTLANIAGPSGDANAKQDFGYEIHINGKPTTTPKVVASALTAVVAGGSVSGTTSFTATPGASNTLAYKLGGATFGNLYASQYLSGYIDYTSGNDIPAAVGQFLLMIELDANKRVVNFAEQELAGGDITA